MKFLLSAAVFLTLIGAGSSVHAEWVPVDNKMMCQTTAQAFDEFKQKSFQPMAMSQNTKGMVTVWINSERSMLVTQTIGSYQDGITCVALGGTKSMWLELSEPEDSSKKNPT